MIIILYILNLLDAAFTHYWLVNDMGVEANPIMNWAWENDMFWFIKVVVIGAASYLLWRMSSRRYVRRAIYGMTLIYTLIFGYHIGGYLWLH